jgi:hypothetical protein
MPDDYIKKALQEACKEYFQLQVKRDGFRRQVMEVEKQSFALLPKIHSLAELCPPAPDSPIGKLVRRIAKSGLTDAVGNILEGTGEWMSPVQIRDQMIRFRVDLTRYKNPVSSIHTILGRWVDSGEVEQQPDEKTGKIVFRWKQPVLIDNLATDDSFAEHIVEHMIDPRPSKARKRKAKTEKMDEMKLLTEGSLKVN